MLPTNFLLLAAAAIPMATALRSKTQDGPGVFGWCDFTWANANKVQNVQCGAGDRAGDSHPVFSEVRQTFSIIIQGQLYSRGSEYFANVQRWNAAEFVKYF